MKVSINGYYTVPDYTLYISIPLLQLLAQAIEKQLLIPYNFNEFNKDELEIYLCTDAIDDIQTNELKNNKNSEYLSFNLWLPYYKVTDNEQLNITEFINCFTDALKHALDTYKSVPETVYHSIKENVTSKTTGNNKYVYQHSKKQKAWIYPVKKKRNERKVKKVEFNVSILLQLIRYFGIILIKPKVFISYAFVIS